jgi:hypothetical protein
MDTCCERPKSFEIRSLTGDWLDRSRSASPLPVEPVCMTRLSHSRNARRGSEVAKAHEFRVALIGVRALIDRLGMNCRQNGNLCWKLRNP